MRIHLAKGHLFHMLTVLVLAAGLGEGRAEERGKFHWRNPYPTGNSLGKLAFGDGRFVTTDGLGYAFVTTNGVDWSRELMPETGWMYAMAFGGGRFVTVGYSGAVVSSEGDGWALRDSGTGEIFYDVAYGNGWFVVVDNGGGVTRSPDGVNWTHQSNVNPSTPYLHEVAFGNGVFVIIDHQTNALVSVDGAAWTAHTISAPANHLGLVYAKGKFFVTGRYYSGSPGSGYDARTYSSVDGKTWSVEPTVPFPRGSAAGDDRVVMLTSRKEPTYEVDEVSISSDGTNWTHLEVGHLATLRSLAHGNGIYVGVGEMGEVARSTNGVNWERTGGDRSFNLTAGVYHNGKYVFVGDTILVSSNARTFTPVHGPVDGRDVALGNGVLMMVGAGGQVMRSTDGEAWSAMNSGTGRTLHGVAHGAGRFVAVGDEGTIRTLPDGGTWQGPASNTDRALKDVAYGKDRFVAVGAGGTILTSVDGSNWALQQTGDLDDLEGVAFGNGQFVAVGATSTVLTSPDGEMWTAQDVTLDYPGIMGIAFGSGTFYIRATDGDYTRRLYRSTDGRKWTGQDYGSTYTIKGLSHLNGTFMLYGGSGMILQSDPFGPSLSGAYDAAAGEFTLTFTGGELGRAYRLQQTDDLSASNWENVSSFTMTQEAVRMVISTFPSASQKFYRAVSP